MLADMRGLGKEADRWPWFGWRGEMVRIDPVARTFRCPRCSTEDFLKPITGPQAYLVHECYHCGLSLTIWLITS